MRNSSLHRARRALPLLTALCLFALLTLFSAPAAEAARKGLALCAQVIVPSLMPFFVLSGLLSALGLSRALGAFASPLMQKLFSVSGSGAAAFLVGLTGGYPLGASTVASLYKKGEISEAEAKRLLCFCNNSGPAFIIGAAGSGIFGSAKAGLILYASHVLSAILCGFLFSRRGKKAAAIRETTAAAPIQRISEAFPEAVSAAVRSTVMICGYVVFFSVLTGLLDALGMFSSLSGILSVKMHLGLGQSRALLTGLLEIGSALGSMLGQPYSPLNMAICAFILGWGGLSVQFQTRAVLGDTPLSRAPISLSKLLHGLLSAPIAAALCILFR